MPNPMDGESREDFMKRCIPMVIDDGTASDSDQAVAICSSMWDDRGKSSGRIEYGRPLEIKAFKSSGSEWTVEGYQSTFGNIDFGRDAVLEGAFKKTLKSGPKKRFFLSHEITMPLGIPKRLFEDKEGLYGEFKISKTRLGEDAHQLLEDGALDSFSIGYQAVDYEIDKKTGVRYLKEIELFECSLVSMPMNPLAVVTGYKNLGIRDDMTLTEKIHAYSDGLSKLYDEIRGLSDKHPLNESKRQELMELLETFSGMDDVRSSIQSVLTPRQSSLVEARRVKYRLAELRSQSHVS